MRQKYINMRNSKTIDGNVMYQYLLENGGKSNPDMFIKCFNFINMNDVLDFLDHKFELNLLFDINGAFIKVVS